MKKIILSALLLTGMSVMAYADVFPESFEKNLTETGWTATSSNEASNNWSIVKYASETSQFPQLLNIPEGVGESTLKSQSKGAFGGNGLATDNFIFSPEFTVGNDGWLTFMLASNMAGNAAANVTDEMMASFYVLVSPTGGSAREDFTDVVFTEVPVGLNPWKMISINLSQYAGSQIRIAFNVKNETCAKNLVVNQLYVDDIKLVAEAAPDMALGALSGFKNGTLKSQCPTVIVKNYGDKVDAFKLKVKVNDIEQFEEEVSMEIENNESVDYTLTHPVTLSEGDNKVTVTLVYDEDTLESNNTSEATVNILTVKSLPFELAEGDEGASQMKSTASGNTRNPDGWQFMANTQQAWIHTRYTKDAYLYTADGYALEKGVLKVSFDTEMTGEEATFEIYLTKDLTDFGTPVASKDVLKAESNGFMLVNIEEPGDYILALHILGGNSKEQIKLNGLKIEIATTLPDLAVNKVTVKPSVLENVEFPVEVRIVNEGSETARNVNVSYKINDINVTEALEDIAAGQEVNHTFAQPLSLAKGDYELEVEVASDYDFATDNNSLKVPVNAYEAFTIPYKESFEKESAANLWTAVNTNSSDVKWTPIGGYEFDGTHILSLGSYSLGHDAWVISPAISIEEGWKGRLSYYFGSGGNYGTCSLKAYLTRSDNPSEIAESTPLIVDFVGETNVAYTSEYVDIDEAGTYYIAFYATGGTQPLLIDDVRLDSTNEVAVVDASLSHQNVDYNLEDGKVTMKIHNYGMSDITDPAVGYMLYVTANGVVTPGELVEESYKGTIAPGEEKEYEFVTPAKFDKEGMYTVTTALLAENDTDLKNNTFAAVGPELLATMQVPAMWDHEISDHLHGYVFDKMGAWKLGAIDPYDGNRSLAHMSGTLDKDGDQMALNRVFLPAGKYEFSFFWKTLLNQVSDEYPVSFNIQLSTSPDVKDSKINLFSVTKGLAAEKCHAKALKEFEIKEDGYYWVVLNVSTAGIFSSLCIDNISIKPIESDLSLMKEGDEYVADFSLENDGWQYYHPNGMIAQQWKKHDDGEGTYLQLDEFRVDYADYLGSWIQAPSMDLSKDMDYDLTVDVEILPYDEDTPLTGNESVKLYASEYDLPGQFQEFASFTGKKTINCRPASDGRWFMTLKANSETRARFRLKGFSIKAMHYNSVGQLASENDSWKLTGNQLIFSQDTEGEIFTISGVKIFSGNGIVTLDPGLYIVKTPTRSAKILVK